MTSEDLVRLVQNEFYVQAYEFFMAESTRLSEMLEEMGWNPSTPEQRQSIKLQCERMKQSRVVLHELREVVLAGASSNNVAGSSVAAD